MDNPQFTICFKFEICFHLNEPAHRHHNTHKDMTALADAMGVDQGYSVALPANYFGKR